MRKTRKSEDVLIGTILIGSFLCDMGLLIKGTTHDGWLNFEPILLLPTRILPVTAEQVVTRLKEGHKALATGHFLVELDLVECHDVALMTEVVAALNAKANESK